MISLYKSRFKLRFTTNFKVALFRVSMQNTRHYSAQTICERGNR